MTKVYVYYRTCKRCQVKKELTGKNFRRHNNKGTSRYYLQCKQCDAELKNKEHWKGDSLKCFICNEYKLPEEFSKSKANKHRGGRDRRCNACRSLESKKYRESLSGADQVKRHIKERWLGARDRAKRKKLDFSVTEDYIIELLNKQKYKCALSGTALTFELGNGRTPTNMSIDRIDSRMGYVQNNVQLICSAVNQFKNDLPQEYFLEMCKKIVAYYENTYN